MYIEVNLQRERKEKRSVGEKDWSKKKGRVGGLLRKALVCLCVRRKGKGKK